MTRPLKPGALHSARVPRSSAYASAVSDRGWPDGSPARITFRFTGVCLRWVQAEAGSALGSPDGLFGGTVWAMSGSAGEGLEDNLNPVGRTYYGLSTVICTPASLDQEVALGLGAQAGERRRTGRPRR